MKKKKKEEKLNISDKPATVNGKYTFVGILQSYFPEISKNWNADTQSAYVRDYNVHILPRLQNIPLEDYTQEMFDEIINAIYLDSCARGDPYAESTMAHYRYICRAVTKTAYNHGICSDVLWGTLFSDTEKAEGQSTANRQARLRRSLSEAEEWKLSVLLYQDCKAVGEWIGLAIMHALGCRPQELCGLNYENIVQKQVAGQTFYVLQIISSTKQRSNERKTGGKTKNAPRLLPIPDKLAKLLLDRKAYLNDLIAQGELDGVGPEHRIASAEELPIVCKGMDYLKRCSADELSKAGKELLRTIKLDEQIMIDICTHIQDMAVGDQFYEKDPTTYLLRRNFATKTMHLGFTNGELHYLMGHDTSDDDIGNVKSMMTNPDYLLCLKNRLERRNYIGSAVKSLNEEIHMGNLDYLEGSTLTPGTIHLNADGTKNYFIIITPNEPEPGELIVRKRSGDLSRGSLRTVPIANHFTSDVMAIGTYTKIEQQAKSRSIGQTKKSHPPRGSGIHRPK